MKRPLIMGIVNVTPDSFSDGGRWFGEDAACEHAHQLVAEGADIVDIGGESTRPGARRPEPAEELRRVVPVVEALAGTGVKISVDTMRANVAQAAMAAGAHIINDVSGGLADEQMAGVAAETGATFVAMHWRGHSIDMQSMTQYNDIVLDVCAELGQAVARAMKAGVRREKIVVDPGFGFSKTAEQNWELLARMNEFSVDGLPVLWGTSRKSFLGQAGRTSSEAEAGALIPPQERVSATVATSVLAAQQGAWGVRVHDVRATAAALDVAACAAGMDRRTENG